MRALDLLGFFLAILSLLSINSCTYEDCRGDERIDYIPTGFHNKIKGLETHSQWIFTDGNGNFDTLTALGPVTQAFWKHNDVCVSQEKIERKFRWSANFPPNCREGTEMTLLALRNEGRVQFIFSSDVYGNTRCVDLEGNYNDSISDFLERTSLNDGFTTPYNSYKNAFVLPFLVNSHATDFKKEILIFNNLEGLIGYTFNGDTLLLTSLIK